MITNAKFQNCQIGNMKNIMLILKDVIIIITVLNWAYPQQNQNFLKVLTKFYLKKI